MKPKFHILVCYEQREPTHPKGCCSSKHSPLLFQKFRQEVERRGWASHVRVTPTGCLGPCTEGCVAVVYPDAVWYGKLRMTDVPEILDQHIARGKKIDRLIIDDELLD